MALFDFNGLPGLGTAYTSSEVAFLWGKHEQAIYRSGVVVSTTTDLNNTPTNELRAGLIMAQLSTGKWTTYNPTNSDGSEYAAGILANNINTTSPLSGLTGDHVGVIVVYGPLKADQLIRNISGSSSIDPLARALMSKNFIFDDQLTQNPNPWFRSVPKTAAYTVTLAESGTEFTNTGAAGSVTFTLPALLDTGSNVVTKGVLYRFTTTAAQALVVASSGGTDPVIFYNDSAHHTFTTNGNVGITMEFRVNDDGTKWLVTVLGSTQTVVTAS